jgi:hypothetical protein
MSRRRDNRATFGRQRMLRRQVQQELQGEVRTKPLQRIGDGRISLTSGQVGGVEADLRVPGPASAVENAHGFDVERVWEQINTCDLAQRESGPLQESSV